MRTWGPDSGLPYHGGAAVEKDYLCGGKIHRSYWRPVEFGLRDCCVIFARGLRSSSADRKGALEHTYDGQYVVILVLDVLVTPR